MGSLMTQMNGRKGFDLSFETSGSALRKWSTIVVVPPATKLICSAVNGVCEMADPVPRMTPYWALRGATAGSGDALTWLVDAA